MSEPKYSQLVEHKSTVGCGNVPATLIYISDKTNVDAARNYICFGVIETGTPYAMITVNKKDDGSFFVISPQQRIELAQWLLDGVAKQQTPFVALASPELIALCEKGWTKRAERNNHEYNKRSWIAGWMEGYFSKTGAP